jgi:hypothetical protein
MIVEFEIKMRFDNRAKEPFTAEIAMILDYKELPDWFYSSSELMGEKMTGYWGFNVNDKKARRVNLSHSSLSCLNSSIHELMEDSMDLLNETKKTMQPEIDKIRAFEKITHHI